MLYTVSLKKNRDFRRVYSRGKSAVNRTLVLYKKPNGLAANRLGITVASKVGGAVVRNRVRRRIKEAYRTSEQVFLKGFDLVVVARVRAADADYKEIHSALFYLSGKLSLLKSPGKDNKTQA